MNRRRVTGRAASRVFGVARLASSFAEMVVDRPGHICAQAVAGVIGDPSLVFVLA